MTKHTPTPWKMEQWGENHFAVVSDNDGQNHAVMQDIYCYAPEKAANAAFIVRACNAHEALVRELQAMYDHMIDRGEDEESDGMIAAATALALAGE